MSDMPKSKFTPGLPDLYKGSLQKEPLHTTDFDYTTLSVGKLTESRQGYINNSSFYHPTFYETEKTRGTELVDMGARGKVVVANGEERRIATFGLCGCTAVAVALEMSDGTRSGYVQHYSPLNRALSASMLGEALQDISANLVSARAVIMTPGEWTQDPAVKWPMSAKDQTLTNLLTAVAYQGLGVDADVQVYPYSEMQQTDRYGQGTLMVEFRMDGFTNILAETMLIQPQA